MRRRQRLNFSDPARIDERFLLWFHHLPWDHPMPSGRPLWHELVARYDRGVAATGAMRRTWAGLADHVDARRHAEVADFLAIQEERGALVAGFLHFLLAQPERPADPRGACPAGA